MVLRIEPDDFERISSTHPGDAKADRPKRFLAQPLSVNHRRPHAFPEAAGDLRLNDRATLSSSSCSAGSMASSGVKQGFQLLRGHRSLTDSRFACCGRICPCYRPVKGGFELFRSRAENLLTSATAPNSGTERAVEQANNRISPCFSRDNRWQGRGDRFHQTASTTIQSWRIEVVSRLERIVVISMAWLYPKRSAVGISLISARSAPGSGRQSLAAKFRFPDQQM